MSDMEHKLAKECAERIVSRTYNGSDIEIEAKIVCRAYLSTVTPPGSGEDAVWTAEQLAEADTEAAVTHFLIHNKRHDEAFADAFLEFAKTLKASAAAAGRDQWRPIESAPKDGTEILVYVDVASVPVVHIAWYRNKAEWEESGRPSGWDSLEEWEGWWSYTENSVSQTKLEDFKLPTHWMPLPPSPSTKE